jgi:hypothetical protein
MAGAGGDPIGRAERTDLSLSGRRELLSIDAASWKAQAVAGKHKG